LHTTVIQSNKTVEDCAINNNAQQKHQPSGYDISQKQLHGPNANPFQETRSNQTLIHSSNVDYIPCQAARDKDATKAKA